MELSKSVDSIDNVSELSLDQLERISQMCVCPVCNEQIPSPYSDDIIFNCPHCRAALELVQADRVDHFESEINPESTGNCTMGLFCAWYVPKGMVGCHCGHTYPDSFTCCPKLLSMAVGLPLYMDAASAMISIKFIESHLSTFEKCLASSFSDLFSVASLQQFQNEFDNLMSESFRRILATAVG